MLLSIHIKNYALIGDLRLEFGPGLNIFTGETGAGKSIIVDSLGLILGERASAQNIKQDAARCSITGEFDISKLKNVKKYLDELGISNDSGSSLLIRREFDRSGKSRAFINDSPVSINTLLETGRFIVDVHGQHEHQSLFYPSQQLELLDGFAGLEKDKESVSKKYALFKELSAKAESQSMSEQEKHRLIDLYSFQIKEIENAGLYAGEEEEIENILPQLKNAEKLRELSSQANDLLSGSEGSALEKAAGSRKLVENINSVCGALGETLENMNSAYYQLEESSREIEDFLKNLSADPEKLNNLLERQDLIHKLKKKYGQNIPEILAFKEKTEKELNAIESGDSDRQELETKIINIRQELAGGCKKLSAGRKKAVEKLSKLICTELSQLGMKKAKFDISIEQLPDFTANGQDEIEFMFSANPGEPLKPLRSTASGGEMSRVMLAIKTVFAKADSVPVLVFDEIDAGVGGPTGQVVGKKLKTLSKNHQILCITHLPQIASYYDSHFFVKKEVKDKSTEIAVQPLNDSQSLLEVARMLSGIEITPTAKKHAEELISQSRI